MRDSHYERSLLVAFPSIRVWKPVERSKLLCMLRIGVVATFLLVQGWTMPAVTVMFSHTWQARGFCAQQRCLTAVLLSGSGPTSLQLKTSLRES
jgi:hypothetical protein